MAEKGIEIFNQNAIVSQGGIEIHFQNKPSYSENIGFVYLLIDASGSMGDGQKLGQAKRGALKFAREATSKGYYVGLIKFDSDVTHLCNPQKDLSILDRALATMIPSGTTDMTNAIRLATQKLSEKSPAKVICIITDGFPDDPLTTLDAAKNAKKNKIDIITVGTDDADQDFLKKIATRAELGIKVPRDRLEEAIASTAKMLPAGNRKYQ